MKDNSTVSIIVPVYRAGRFLPATIESVLAQTHTDWELVLVEDRSPDNSREVIEAYASKDARIRPIFQEENHGAAYARNTGVMQSRGRYIAFLDADDIWRPGKLELELEFMKKSEFPFVFSGYEFADEQARGLGRVVRVPESLTYRQALKNTTIFTSTVLLDTAVIPRSLIQMPLVKSEDTALWWKILKTGITAGGLDENLVLYRRSPGTLSSDKLEAVRRIWFLYRKQEGLSVPYSAFNFAFYAVRAVKRRI